MQFQNIWISGLALFLLTCRSDRQQTDNNFQIHPDFKIELVASEPLVMDPVDMEFDHHGAAYVLEMPGYPLSEDQSRIILLEDLDGDGVFDKRTLFSDSLTVATSLKTYQGGFLVAAPPDLLFISDTDGDKRADLRQVVMSGFTVDNTQHNFNGLTYGLDNWIYGANGGNSGSVFWTGREESPISLMYHDFRLKIEDQNFELTGTTSGGFELAMDNWGHIFGTHNMVHISHLVFPQRYIHDIPWLHHNILENISDHEEAGTSRIYPIGEQVTRVNHPEQSGYFSGACGIAFYGGNAFPDPFNGNIFVADVVLNLIHRDVVMKKGTTYSASRGREGIEFLASEDRAFRPVNMTVGPDGAMYLLDMHRTVIEHPEWIPDEIEETLDLYDGQDKGRVYRITPKRGSQYVKPVFDGEYLNEVVNALEHPNQWWRITAQRLLIEWKATEAVPALGGIIRNSKNPLARLHALWTLEGLNSLTDDLKIIALHDPDPGLRQQGVILSEEGLAQETELMSAITALGSDPDPKVKMQAALTLATVMSDQTEIRDQIRQTLQMIAQDASDPWIRLAVISGSQHFPLEIMQALLNEKQDIDFPGKELLNGLATLVGKNHRYKEVLSLLEVLAAHEVSVVTGILDGLADGCMRSTDISAGWESSSGLINPLGKLEKLEIPSILLGTWRLRELHGLPAARDRSKVISRATKLLLDPEQGLEIRLEYLRLISVANFEGKDMLLLDLLQPNHPRAIQLEAVRQLGRMEGLSVAGQLIEIWPGFGPEVRAGVSDILVYKEENHPLLLSSLESGKIGLGEMKFDLERRRMLLFSQDSSIRKRAEALFSDAGVRTREEAIEKMRPALLMKGDPKSGESLYQILCATCHRFKDLGIQVGPDLLGIGRKSDEQILFDILDPNAAVETRYLSHIIETKGGEMISGIVAYESDSEIMLSGINGAERLVLRNEIGKMYSSGLSLMPEGLEEGLEPQDMADLLAFLKL